MADFGIWTLFWFLFMTCVAPVKIYCQLVKVFEVCVVPWKTGTYSAWLSTGAGQTCAQSMSTTDDAWCTDMFSCWHCQRVRHWLGSAQNCLGPTGLQRTVCTLGAKESHRWWQSSLYGTVWAFLVFIGHVNTDQREQFWRWNMVNYAKPDTRKRMCDTETIISLQQRKWSIVISKLENCLGTIIMYLFCISLTMVTLCCLLLWYT